jgi:hypothetical protein
MAGGARVHCKYDELWPLDKLRPNPVNPNKHPAEQVAALAKVIAHPDIGIRHPITVSRRSGLIVAGHCRLLAAKALKLDVYPVEIQDYKDQATENLVLLEDNKIAELSEWDGPKLADIFVEFDEQDIDLDLTGFDEKDIRYYVEGPTDMPVVDNQGGVDTRGNRLGLGRDSKVQVVSIGLLNEIIAKDTVEALGKAVQENWDDMPVTNFCHWALDKLEAEK